MTGGLPRTEFGARHNYVLRAAGGIVLSVVAFCIAVVLAIWMDWPSYRSVPTAVLAGLVSVAVSVGCGYVIKIWAKGYLLRVDRGGVTLWFRGRQVVIPWQDVDCWWLGVPQTRWGRRLGLHVRPAAHVTDPGGGARSVVWYQSVGCWLVGEPDLLDGSVDELLTALRTAAPQLEAAVRYR